MPVKLPEYRLYADKDDINPMDPKNNWTARHKYLLDNNLILPSQFMPMAVAGYIQFGAEDEEKAAKICAYLKKTGLNFNKVEEVSPDFSVKPFDYETVLQNTNTSVKKNAPAAATPAPPPPSPSVTSINTSAQTQIKQDLDQLKGKVIPLIVQSNAPEVATALMEKFQRAAVAKFHQTGNAGKFNVFVPSLEQFVKTVSDASKGKPFKISYDDGTIFAHSDGKKIYDKNNNEVNKDNPLVKKGSDITKVEDHQSFRP